MLQFVLSCLILLSFILWWVEAEYNFIYGMVMWLKDVCNSIKNKTKLKIDICKWFLPFILIIGSIYTFYYPYFKQTLEFKQGTFVIRDYSGENKEKELVSTHDTKNIENEEGNNPIGDWGTFGDFVGGTLNPIIGFISILLLFATWKVTRKTLDVSKRELRNSNELLSTQQFDAIFWGLFQNLKRIEENLYKVRDYDQLIVDEIYFRVFYCGFKKNEKHLMRRNIILQDAELSQYFICLYQIFKNIDERILLGDKEEEKRIKKAYSNILRASVPTKLLQLLAVNCHEDFEEYKAYLEAFGFFEHMPFYYIGNQKMLNLGLLECLAVYDENVFDQSIYYKNFKVRENLNVFFKYGIKDYKEYINDYLMKGFDTEKSIEDESLNLKIKLNWYKDSFQLVWYGSYKGEEMRKEICNQWLISIDGMEVQVGALNYYLVINSFSQKLLYLKKNPL